MTKPAKHGHKPKSRMDKTGFKQRRKYGFIVIEDTLYQFTWARTKGYPVLIMYDAEGNRYVYEPGTIQCPECQRALNSHRVWHGKDRTGPCFGGWGKPEARAIWLMYNKPETHEHLHHVHDKRNNENSRRNKEGSDQIL